MKKRPNSERSLPCRARTRASRGKALRVWLTADIGQKMRLLTHQSAPLVSANDRYRDARPQAASFEALRSRPTDGFRLFVAFEARIGDGATRVQSDDAGDGRRKKSATEGFGDAAWTCLGRSPSIRSYRARLHRPWSASRGPSRNRCCDCSFSLRSIRRSLATMRRAKMAAEKSSIFWSETGISVFGRITPSVSCGSLRLTSSKRANLK